MMNVYGLIGYPLSHSFSKKYFTQKFETEGPGTNRFELFPLDDISHFTKLIRSQPYLKGLAVTIPYKESVISYLNLVDEEARRIGAVNCIKITGEILKGFNTDILGFEKSLLPLLPNAPVKALVLGSGGASKAVQYVLNKLGIGFLIVTRKEAEIYHSINYDDLTQEVLKSYLLIINCTPVGMFPNEHTYPKIPYQFLGNKHILYDLVYAPAQTNFMNKGAALGASVKNGYEMLVLQAEENWRIWNDS